MSLLDLVAYGADDVYLQPPRITLTRVNTRKNNKLRNNTKKSTAELYSNKSHGYVKTVCALLIRRETHKRQFIEINQVFDRLATIQYFENNIKPQQHSSDIFT